MHIQNAVKQIKAIWEQSSVRIQHIVFGERRAPKIILRNPYPQSVMEMGASWYRATSLQTVLGHYMWLKETWMGPKRTVKIAEPCLSPDLNQFWNCESITTFQKVSYYFPWNPQSCNCYVANNSYVANVGHLCCLSAFPPLLIKLQNQKTLHVNLKWMYAIRVRQSTYFLSVKNALILTVLESVIQSCLIC